MNTRRLYRSRSDRQLTGVAGGMAAYLDVDPTVVRVLWVLGTLFSGGLGLLLYIILAFVVPNEPWPMAAYGAPSGAAPAFAGGTAGPAAPATEPGAEPGTDETITGWTSPAGGWTAPAPAAGWDPAAYAPRPRGDGKLGLAFGIVLVVFGTLALLGPMFPAWFSGIALGPAFLVALGLALLAVSIRRPTTDS